MKIILSMSCIKDYTISKICNVISLCNGIDIWLLLLRSFWINWEALQKRIYPILTFSTLFRAQMCFQCSPSLRVTCIDDGIRPWNDQKGNKKFVC